MSFEKRVCVLKQVRKGFTADGSALSGAVYVERMGTELTVMPRLLGIAPVKDGRYALALWIEGSVFVVDLEGAASVRLETPSIKAGLAVLLVFVRGEAEPVAFGSCGLAPAEYSQLLAAFSKSEKRGKPSAAAPSAQTAGEEEETPPFREPAAAKYDDEAIAEGNYYAGGAGDDDGPSAGKREEAEEAAADGSAPPHNDDPALLRPRGTLTYYHSVRARIEAAFARFPKDERLNAAFPCSEWVRTEAGLLGVIYENGVPRYLCVAVEGKDPPEEMGARACFVPSTPFSDEIGFWVVFQSADSGEYVTVSDC